MSVPPESGRGGPHRGSGRDEVQRLRTELSRLQTMVDLQRRVLEANQHPAAVMDIVAAGAMELADAEGAVVELTDGAEMVYAAAAGVAKPRVGLRLPARGSLSGRCVREKRALHSPDTSTDPRVDRDACRAVGARSMVVVPLLDQDQCLGVLKVYAGEPQAFDDSVIAALQQLSPYLALALRHADDIAASRHAAVHDPLTGLANRTLLFDRLTAAMTSMRRDDRPVVVAYVDLDHFKGVNDAAGHAAGDALLMDTARRLQAAVRADDTVGRLGGDEFVVVCAGGLSEQQLAQRVEQALHAAPPIHATVGTATVRPGDTPSALVDRADAAMYARKSRGSG